MKLSEITACELKKLLASGETSCVEIMKSVIEEIDNREGEIQAYILIRDKNELIAEADKVDNRRQAGEKIGALAGLPIAIKDNICTKDIATTCGSKILKNFIPPYEATVVEKIKNADGIIIGKTNMDEFAMGSSTENSAEKITSNPAGSEYVPGGSSGGSAAAVAAGECILAIGSDTGGSIRQPASFCGVVGLKPTYGKVSRYGLVAYGSSLDQIGPICKEVKDASLLYNVIAGHDPKDSTSLNVEDENKDIKKIFNIGVPKEYFSEGLDSEVQQSVEKIIELLRTAGHSIEQISLPHTEYAVPTYYLIACAEASSNLARYDGVGYGHRANDPTDIIDMFSRSRSEGFGAEVKRRIMLGTYVLSAGFYDAYYLKAQKVRTLIANDFKTAFETCDVIINPVAPTPAFKIGEKTSDPLEMYLGDIYSVTANLAGLPAISVPCGKTKSGLPIGVQLSAKPLDESLLLSAAEQIESLQ